MLDCQDIHFGDLVSIQSTPQAFTATSGVSNNQCKIHIVVTLSMILAKPGFMVASLWIQALLIFYSF
jgi:hypothetical protein